jgi:hypothetical protein
MATRETEFYGSLEELKSKFKELLKDANFLIIDEENRGDGLRILAVNRKRTSIMASTLLSIFTGYITQTRFAIELIAHKNKEAIKVVLKCVPYIDNVDMEARVETPEDLERCEKLVELFGSKIIDLMDSGSEE